MARLFFALWPDTETRHSLLKIRDTLPADNGRLVIANNLHITLVFLGDVSTEKAECVTDRVRQLRIKPVTLILDRIGWWKKTQVLWLAPAHIPEEVPIFAAELATASTQCAIKLDQRPTALFLLDTFVNFFTMNGDIFRRINTNAHLISSDAEYSDSDIVTYYQRLTNPSS